MYCFGKSQRLLKKFEFDFVFKEAKKIMTPELVLLYRANSLGHARVGLALSKKNIPKAHDRNRVKRLIRETFRTKDLPGVDIVILARQGIYNIQDKLTATKMGQAWDKLSVLCGK